MRFDAAVAPMILAVTAMALVLGAQAAEAGSLTLSTKGRTGIFKSQLAVLDGRAAQQYMHSERLKPKTKSDDTAATPVPRFAGKYSGPYLEMAKSAARKHGVPEDLFLRLVQQESGFNPGAVSVKGAVGLTQLMPGTATRLGVDPNDPTQNLEGGARYLKLQFDKFGSWRLALAAYNAGPEAVNKHSGVPPYAETQNYVLAILGS